ncbi:MAG: hypothetical protein J1F43_03590 [Muribaculaceae bacterium]|nr:hypothetical protein [Muribaculaceae bacterium]
MKNSVYHLRVTIFVGFILLIGSNNISHAKKIFYDSKSWIVNVAGDANILQDVGLESKINPIKVNVENPLNDSNYLKPKTLASMLTNEGYGKKLINALTANGTSDELLKKLAFKNVQKQDIEFATNTLIGGENENALTTYLKDEYLPILMHNYYCFLFNHTYEVPVTTKSGSKKTETRSIEYYAIYKVDVDSEEAFDIIASIGDPQRYNSLNFPVSFVSGGLVSKLEKNLEKDAPDLMLRGVLTQRNPAKISIGRNAGLKAGDLVSIYSQKTDKKGQPYSKRISRARVGKVWGNEAQMNFESNLAGNRKNGDVVVRTRDKHTRLGIMATWQPHVWGGQIFSDTKVSFTRSGIINHFLFDLSFSMTDKPGQKFISLEDANDIYKSPLFANAGLGYGISKTFLGYFDIMPFFLAQYEMAIMPKVEGSNTPLGSSVRIPIGIRFSFNVAYPVKFILEGGYTLKWGFGTDYQKIKQACEYLDAKRDGLFINAGFIF